MKIEQSKKMLLFQFTIGTDFLGFSNGLQGYVAADSIEQARTKVSNMIEKDEEVSIIVEPFGCVFV